MALMASCSPYLILLLQFLCLVLLWTIPNSTSKPTYLDSDCPRNVSTTIDNKYKLNLKTLLRFLPIKSSTKHFYSTSFGTAMRDTVYGFYLCRADMNATTCHDCVTAAATFDLPKTYCPNSKEAVIWYDQCMLRYSNNSLFGKLDVTPSHSLVNSQNYHGNHTQFFEILISMVNRMVAETANNSTWMKFSKGMVNVTNSTTLYVMEQCTPDLSPEDCIQCLKTAINQLPLKQGGRVLTPSCLVDYEIYQPFYTHADNNSMINAIIEKGINSSSGVKQASGNAWETMDFPPCAGIYC